MTVTLPYSPFSQSTAFATERVRASALDRAARSCLPPPRFRFWIQLRLYADRVDDRAGNCRRDRGLCDSGVSGLSGPQSRRRGSLAGSIRAACGVRKRCERKCVRRRVCVAACHSQRRIRSRRRRYRADHRRLHDARRACRVEHADSRALGAGQCRSTHCANCLEQGRGAVRSGHLGMFRRRQNSLFVACARRRARTSRYAFLTVESCPAGVPRVSNGEKVRVSCYPNVKR
ncbi:hypothetical protein R75461_03984 [Paraburkholderia nemoris]|nr:hypothetical protein R75461_03984 [Paraburkholderia nemoris]